MVRVCIKSHKQTTPQQHQNMPLTAKMTLPRAPQNISPRSLSTRFPCPLIMSISWEERERTAPEKQSCHAIRAANCFFVKEKVIVVVSVYTLLVITVNA